MNRDVVGHAHRVIVRRTTVHGIALALLIGGFLVSQLRAESAPVPAAIAAPEESILDKWLKPDVVIGGVLVILYAGELRGDIRRLKEDQRSLADRLHDDYMPRKEVEAMLGRRATDHV